MGVVAAALLSGVISLQVYLYYHRWNCNQDSARHVIGVAVLWFLDIFHLALTVHFAYVHLINHWGTSLKQLLFQQSVPWSIKLQVGVKLLIVTIVHSLYASRVWMLGGFHKGYLGYVAAAIVCMGLIVGGLLANAVGRLNSYSELKSIGWAIYTALSAWTTIDFFIAFSMWHYLSMTAPHEINLSQKISRMIRHSVTSGLLLSTLSLLTIFLFRFTMGTFIFFCFQFILSKTYILSFLAMLNARDPPGKRSETFKTISCTSNVDSAGFQMQSYTSKISHGQHKFASEV